MSINLSGFKKALLLVFLFELFNVSLKANPGDTTWVTIFDQKKLTYYGNYDTTTTLPTGKRYRKIRLHYILATYPCPGNPQYCGSWDYTTQIFAKPANNDTVEIARVITPYATNWLSQNKKHDYVIDVTDYAPILDGPLGIMFGYQGYSWGFKVTVKLEMIEGVPVMDALKIKNIYNGYYPYGNVGNPIENYLTSKTFSYASPATKAFIKNSISGHGSDGSDCAEFCNKYYQLKLNNSQIAQKQIWRSDCGLNNVYPQTGTWLFERGNWCPGAVVWPIYHDISTLTTANTNFSVDIDMQAHSDNGSAGYSFVSQLVTYSVANHTRDISIEDIVAPTNDENYFRFNSTCSNPIVRIKNTGTNTITSVVFSYGLSNQAPLTHTWTGSIPFLGETDVTFPPSVSIFTNNTAGVFQVSVTAVNGISSDEDNFNNIYSSKTNTVAVFPPDFVVKMYTNNATDPNTIKQETSWKLYDENGAIIAQRNNLNNLTVYLDTVHLQPGCYKMVIDDSGCDGYDWWAYQYYTPNPGTGTLRYDYASFPSTFYTFQGDFGCNLTKYFRVTQTPVSIKNNSINPNLIDVFPNPASNELYIKFDLGKSQQVTYSIKDVTGKIILEKNLNNVMAAYEKVDISNIANGVYFVSLELDNKESFNKKLVIQR